MLHALSSMFHRHSHVFLPDTYAVPVDATDPTIGPKHAKVTIIEPFEFRCPYSLAGSWLVRRLLAEFPNDVRFVAKHRIIHGEPAVLPAVAFFAASRQGKTLEMHNGLWELYWLGQESNDEMDDAGTALTNVLHLAESLHLNMHHFKKDLGSRDGLDWIERSQDEMSNFGVFSVPNFFINGRFTPRVRYEALRAMVVEEIEANRGSYDEIVKHGQKSGKLELRLFR